MTVSISIDMTNTVQNEIGMTVIARITRQINTSVSVMVVTVLPHAFCRSLEVAPCHRQKVNPFLKVCDKLIPKAVFRASAVSGKAVSIVMVHAVHRHSSLLDCKNLSDHKHRTNADTHTHQRLLVKCRLVSCYTASICSHNI